MINDNLQTLWAEIFVCALAERGVSHAVISPGSRSTPLTLAFFNHPKIEVTISIDERSAAFFALGITKVTKQPTVVVCTSGSAPAHYFPAIIEASRNCIPLIAVSADRPWEDVDSGANQTIDQVKLFGNAVRHYAELGLPHNTPAAFSAVQRIAAQGIQFATGAFPGPVHINARFRKPLEPATEPTNPHLKEQVEACIATGPPHVIQPKRTVDPNAIKQLAADFLAHPNGIIACGPADIFTNGPDLKKQIEQVSSLTGYPIFAESTSGVRYPTTPTQQGHLCPGFDLLLRTNTFIKSINPSIILEINGPLTSKAYGDFIATQTGVRISINPFTSKQQNPSVQQQFIASPVEFLQQLLGALRSLNPVKSATWTEQFARANQKTARVTQSILDNEQLFESSLAALVPQIVQDNEILCIGNSSPVRDLDSFCLHAQTRPTVFHQRGASGIDGLVSGALGIAKAAQKPIFLYLGDVSFQHDLNGLFLADTINCPVVIIVVQNQGGGIFRRLPLAQCPGITEAFEKAFVVSKNHCFKKAAEFFNCRFEAVETKKQLQSAMTKARCHNTVTIIEARVTKNTHLTDLIKKLDTLI